MKKISIADVTLREGASATGVILSFKEKLEVAKLLDRLGVDIIETAPIEDEKTDTLVLRTLSQLVKSAILSCPTGLTLQGVEDTWNAISSAQRPRLLVCAPVSAVQMEYLSHKKAPKMIETIAAIVTKASELCNDVEFAALDATRAEKEFLVQAITTAIESGAKTITLCDTSGTMLPDEFAELITYIKDNSTNIDNVVISVECSDAMDMANACAISCIQAGAEQIKTNIGNQTSSRTNSISNVIKVKGSSLGIECGVNTMSASQTVPQIMKIVSVPTSSLPIEVSSEPSQEIKVTLDKNSEIQEVSKAVSKLGYDLSEDDTMKVYEAFQRVASKKKHVHSKDLDSIVASYAHQVPPTFKVESYVINSGNIIASTAHIVLSKNGRILQAVESGDGPIDAAFRTLEQIIGHHYELDDFQIQSVTEGKEALGEALIRIRNNGKVYSGRGISTNIIGASIHAYINALNKIVYEEK